MRNGFVEFNDTCDTCPWQGWHHLEYDMTQDEVVIGYVMTIWQGFWWPWVIDNLDHEYQTSLLYSTDDTDIVY